MRHRVVVFPAWGLNPYLNLMELAPRAAGWHIDGVDTADGLLRAVRGLGHGDVLHVHWTTPFVQQAPNAQTAKRRLLDLIRALPRAKERGARVVWTIHNRLPHELRFPGLERDLYRMLARSADAVHIMAPHTPDALADVVALDPGRVRVIPHPSYAGVYETGLGRDDARASFGLDDSDHAVLFLGQIRPYKGVDALIEAASRARRSDGRIVLMLAGDVREMSATELGSLLPDGLRAICRFEYIPDGELARWFRAADVAVFPYRAILNSGSVHLAASFDVPVVLPGEPVLREQFRDQSWVAFFDPDDAVGSIAELLSDDALFAGLDHADFTAFTAPISPWTVSNAYLDLLDAL